jgi:hypothetical protein
MIKHLNSSVGSTFQGISYPFSLYKPSKLNFSYNHWNFAFLLYFITKISHPLASPEALNISVSIPERPPALRDSLVVMADFTSLHTTIN